MKALKWIAIVLLSLVLLLIVGVLIVLNSPGIQKSIVMGQLEGKVQHVELEYVKAGLSSVTIRGLVVDQDGTLIELPSAQVYYSLTDAVFSKKVRISKLLVEDLAITLPAARPHLPMGPGPVILPDERLHPESQPAGEKPTVVKKEEAPSEPPPPFEGIFGKAKTQVQLFIDGVDITASIAISPERKMNVKVTGGGIAPGAIGSIKTTGVLTDASAKAAAAKVEVDGTLQIAQTEDKRLNAIILEVKTDASGGSLTEPASLMAKVNLNQEDSGLENYQFNLSDSSQKDLVDFKATFDPASKKLAGKANYFINHSNLAPITGGMALPGYRVQGSAAFDLNSDTYAGTSSATAKGIVIQFKRADPKLGRLPDMTFSLEYDGAVAADSVTVNKATLDLNQREGGDIVSINLLQPITVGKDFDPTTLSGKVAEVALKQFSLPWISPMVDGISLPSGDLSGTIVAQADKGAITITTEKPLTLANLTASQPKKPLLKNVTMVANLNARLAQNSFAIELKQFKLSDAAGNALITAAANTQGKLDAGKPSDTGIQALVVVAFQPLLQQPFAPQQLAESVEMSLNLAATLPTTEALNVSTLDVALNSGQIELGSVKLLKPLSLNLAAPEKNTPESLMQGDVLQIVLSQLPRPIINAFLGDTQITAGNITAALRVSGDGETVNVKALKPVQATNLSITKGGKPMLQGISATIIPDISYSSAQTSVKLTRLQVTNGAAELVSGTVDIVATPSGESPLQSANLKLKADLAQLLEQPVLADFNNLAAGTATISAVVTTPTTDGTYNVSIEGKDFRIAQPANLIKGISLAANGKLGKTVTLNVPLKIDGPRGTTEAKLNGWVQPGEKPLKFKFDANGETLYTEDLQVLASAFKKPLPASAQSAPAQSPTPATTPPQPTKPAPVPTTKPDPAAPPPWADFNGTATLHVVKVVHGTYEVTDIAAALKVDPSTVILKPAKAKFLDAPMNATITVDHLPGQRPKEPYGLDATLNLAQFDVGKFLILTKPGTTPPLTGQFNVKGGVQGTSAALETIAEKAQGKFSINGGPGQLRALAGVKGGETTGKLASGIAGAASLILGDRVRELPALQQLISLLQQIDYQTLRIEAERAADLNINLNTFLVQGPQVRLNGMGQVKHVAGTPIPQQPLNVAVSLDAKDRTANLMKELRMLTGPQDKQGYFPGPKFNITGTPSAPDFSELNALISKSATEIIGGGFGGKVDKSEATTEKEKSDSEKAVQGLINGLFGK